MFESLEKYDVQKTRRIARAEALEKERKQIVKRLVERNFSIGEVAEIIGLDQEEVKKLM